LKLWSALPWPIYALVFTWPIVIVLIQELVKYRYRKFFENEQHWLKIEFDTRLGMHSPVARGESQQQSPPVATSQTPLSSSQPALHKEEPVSLLSS